MSAAYLDGTKFGAEVRDDHAAAPPQRLDPALQLCEVLGRARGHSDIRALAGEPERDLIADAAAGARYQRSLVFEFHGNS